MKKILLLLGVLVSVVGSASFGVSANSSSERVKTTQELPVSCVGATDGCNTCFRGSGEDNWGCTEMACLDHKSQGYMCTKYVANDLPLVSGDKIDDPVVCPAIYKPVCGSVQVQCIKAPCPPQVQTFGNACTLSASKNATFLYEGECRDDTLKPGEEYRYQKTVKNVLDRTYAERKFTAQQSYDYTQKLVDKIDHTLMTSRLTQYKYEGFQKLKRFLQHYMSFFTK